MAAPSPTAPAWPSRLWIVRHGQSAGNVARERADAENLPHIGLTTRDVDMPLSELGQRQAEAVGRWFGALPEADRPEVILTSPYLRAMATADAIVRCGNLASAERAADERLREKEYGELEGLTRRGITELFPRAAQLYDAVGKFYYRPPGGESWCDVILRLRSFIDTVSRAHAGGRVLLVGHQVVVSCIRYLLEGLSEAEILEIDRRHEIAHASVTAYHYDASAGAHGKLVLDTFNFVAPLEAEGTAVTRAPE